LFLNTNDKSKDLLHFLGSLDESVFIVNNVFKNILAMSILNKMYQYKGYYLYYSCSLDSHVDIEKCLIDILINLGKEITATNEDLTSDEFVEFKKSVILKITKLNN